MHHLYHHRTDKESPTESIRRSCIALLCVVMSVSLLGAQAITHYRSFRMGDDVLAISRQIGVSSSAVAQERGRLDTVTELRWRADYARRGVEGPPDPVERMIFSFHDNQLFRIVIDYSSARTQGMTEADMVAAVSRVYGLPAKRADPPDPVGLEPLRPVDSVVAQWSNDESRVALLALHGRTAFRMIVASTPLETLARAAGAHEAAVDLHDWATADAGRSQDPGTTAAAREQTRRANIVSFIP